MMTLRSGLETFPTLSVLISAIAMWNLISCLWNTTNSLTFFSSPKFRYLTAVFIFSLIFSLFSVMYRKMLLALVPHDLNIDSFPSSGEDLISYISTIYVHVCRILWPFNLERSDKILTRSLSLLKLQFQRFQCSSPGLDVISLYWTAWWTRLKNF